MAMPTAPEPYEELVRGLVAVVDRDVRRQHIERIATRAGVGLGAAAAWLLLRLDQHPDLSLDEIVRQAPFSAETTRLALDELRAAGMIADASPGASGGWKVTPQGCSALERIVAARRAHLAEVFGQWSAGEQQELAALVRRLTPELVPDARSSGGESGR